MLTPDTAVGVSRNGLEECCLATNFRRLYDWNQASRDRRDAVSGNAQQESDTCLDRAFLLLRLMQHTLENGCPPDPSELLTIAQHITCLLQDHERWHTLADNAAYYRDHPQVSARIATLQKR